MSKVYRIRVGKNKDEMQYRIDCPACDRLHNFDKRWYWNGDVEAPTFHPSLLVKYTYGPEKNKVVCHSYVEKGKIRYLDDCTHDMAGQTVELPEIEGL